MLTANPKPCITTFQHPYSAQDAFQDSNRKCLGMPLGTQRVHRFRVTWEPDFRSPGSLN